MRWNKKTAVVGEKRTVNRFAWIPTDLDYPEDEVVWLEWYEQDEEYGGNSWIRGHGPYAWEIKCKYRS